MITRLLHLGPNLKIVSFVMILFLFACKAESIYDTYVIESVVPTGKEKYLNENSNYIFNQDTLHTYELRLPTEELEKINDDPTAEQYVVGSLVFNNDTISPVGIRYKGSVGAFYDSVSGNDWTHPSGHKTSTKLSMKVKIDWEKTGRKFYGLKKLQFHSQNLDNSQMHERLAYWLFGQMGVVAPRSVHARLIINGEYSGVYALTEQIDKQFLKRHYKDASGNLYKEKWPLNHKGEARSTDSFLEGLKTNKKDNNKASIMKSFADSVQHISDSELRLLVQNRLDLRQILAYAVVDRMIKHDDGPFHWYCHEDSCSNHNFYWYTSPTTKKLYLIPWDMDNSFENIGHGKNPVTTVYNKWGDTSNDCWPFKYGDWGLYQKSAACDKLTRSWTTFEAEYAQLKQEFINGPFSDEVVNTKIDKWANQIREATREARREHSDALKEKDWNDALNNLKWELGYSRRKY